MNFIANALQTLPSIATNPLAFVGYALTLAAWVYTYNRSRNLRILMKKIVLIPEQDRKSTVVATLGEPLPDSITAEQWIYSKKQQYFITAFIVTLAVVVIITAIALYRGAQISAAQADAEARIEICKRQLRDVTDQWE